MLAYQVAHNMWQDALEPFRRLVPGWLNEDNLLLAGGACIFGVLAPIVVPVAIGGTVYNRLTGRCRPRKVH